MVAFPLGQTIHFLRHDLELPSPVNILGQKQHHKYYDNYPVNVAILYPLCQHEFINDFLLLLFGTMLFDKIEEHEQQCTRPTKSIDEFSEHLSGPTPEFTWSLCSP